jgi:hypothetical protein
VTGERCPGRCGSTDVHLYACGWRCSAHTPARLAGLPEPDAARYCAPLRCYCGQCPAWTKRATYADGATVIDHRAIASGKRRASPAAYRNARTQVHGAAT